MADQMAEAMGLTFDDEPEDKTPSEQRGTADTTEVQLKESH